MAIEEETPMLRENAYLNAINSLSCDEITKNTLEVFKVKYSTMFKKWLGHSENEIRLLKNYDVLKEFNEVLNILNQWEEEGLIKDEKI